MTVILSEKEELCYTENRLYSPADAIRKIQETGIFDVFSDERVHVFYNDVLKVVRGPQFIWGWDHVAVGRYYSFSSDELRRGSKWCFAITRHGMYGGVEPEHWSNRSGISVDGVKRMREELASWGNIYGHSKVVK